MKSRHSDIGLKIFALVLGLVLWYVVAGEQGTEIAISTPIEFRDVAEGLEVIEESELQADIRLRGSAEILRRLTPKDVSVGVELSEAAPGEMVIFLTPEDVAVPFGVRVVRVTPASIRLRLDQTVEREVNVIPRVIDAPAEGFEIYTVVLTPEAIRVVGPASSIGNMIQVTTEPVSAEGLREPYTGSVGIELAPLVRLVNRTDVKMTLDVREERIRREFKTVFLSSEPEATRILLRPTSIQVTIEGPRTVVEQLELEKIYASVQLHGLPPGKHQVVPVVQILDELNINVVSVTPPRIEARILGSTE